MTSQEVGEGGIMSRDVEEIVCVCVQIGGGQSQEGRGEKGEAYCREPRKEGKKCSHRNGKTLTIIETESREKHTENL